MKQFCKKKDYENCTFLRGKILFYSGRILEGQSILDPENVMSDLEPLSFVCPVLDRYSPVAYSIMLYTHTMITKHRNVVTTLRESRSIAFVFRGRDLAAEIRKNCAFCRRFKAKLLEAELGNIHSTRITIAPAFYNTQVDLFGPLIASCEHNHRSSVKIWGCVFKCPATAAVVVHTMQDYSTAAFLQAYSRFSVRFGYPKKLFIDRGSQLVSGCSEAKLNWADITSTLDRDYQTSIEYETCAVGAHNANGCVERSIKELKKVLNTCFKGIKLAFYLLAFFYYLYG